MSTTTFAQASAVTQRAPLEFDIEINDRWSAARWPNGGYLLATAARAALAVGDHPHILSATAQYARPPKPGPAQVLLEQIHMGRGVSQIRATLRQDDEVRVESMLTLGSLMKGASTDWQSDSPSFPRPGVYPALRVPSVAPSGDPVPIMDEIVIHMDLDTAFWLEPSGTGELRAWLSLPDNEPFDPVSLIFASDALPPATFDIYPTRWAPTISLTTYIRALPADGPVRILQRANMVLDGQVDQSCYIWDRTGKLVAHSTQLGTLR
ncbi:thioesterase family protein [Kribbella sp. NPDC051587]|uniref:thioesterase family protein n=1 Tax=Kribbella sp. NPDC051587 TaxID=3364119 RepID=UPI00378A63B1